MRQPAVAFVLALVLAQCTPAGTQQTASHDPLPAAQPLRKPDVPYEPSPPRVVRAMLRLAKVNDRDIVYDLGSGDGRIPITAAVDFGARAVGIELDPKLVERARSNAARNGVSGRVEFRAGDLFDADIGEATVVTLFLWPEVNLKLRPKLLAELRPGTRIVSHWHDMGDWRADRRIEVEGRPLYMWTVPSRPVG